MNGTRWLWIAQAALGAVLALLLALGKGAAAKMERHDERLAAEEASTASTRAQFDGVQRQLNRIEDKLDRLVEGRR